MEAPYQAADDVFVLPSSQEAPGFGVLPVNAFLLRDDHPVLVDSGLAPDEDDFLSTLWSLVEPEELAWIVLTHDDRDHAGNLLPLLDAAPQAGLVLNFVALGKLGEEWSLPFDRVTVVNPGQRFDTGSRRLEVFRPPVYDSPGTVGFLDGGSGLAFTVDAFGAYLPDLVQDLDEVADDDFRAGFADFNRLNHPWVSQVGQSSVQRALEELQRLQPRMLLSSHGGLAQGRTDDLMQAMAEVARMEPLVPPDFIPGQEQS